MISSYNLNILSLIYSLFIIYLFHYLNNHLISLSNYQMFSIFLLIFIFHSLSTSLSIVFSSFICFTMFILKIFSIRLIISLILSLFIFKTFVFISHKLFSYIFGSIFLLLISNPRCLNYQQN